MNDCDYYDNVAAAAVDDDDDNDDFMFYISFNSFLIMYQNC